MKVKLVALAGALIGSSFSANAEGWTFDLVMKVEENTGACLRRASDPGRPTTADAKIVGNVLEIGFPNMPGWFKMPIDKDGNVDYEARNGGERLRWQGNVKTRAFTVYNMDMGCKTHYVPRP